MVDEKRGRRGPIADLRGMIAPACHLETVQGRNIRQDRYFLSICFISSWASRVRSASGSSRPDSFHVQLVSRNRSLNRCGGGAVVGTATSKRRKPCSEWMKSCQAFPS